MRVYGWLPTEAGKPGVEWGREEWGKPGCIEQGEGGQNRSVMGWLGEQVVWRGVWDHCCTPNPDPTFLA